jgi:hypothetical protein
MKIAACLALALSALFSCGARAYTYSGIGAAPCRVWLDDRGGKTLAAVTAARQDEQWVIGFISGAAYGGIGDPLAGTDATGAWMWMDQYCKENPKLRIINAAQAFIRAHEQ